MTGTCFYNYGDDSNKLFKATTLFTWVCVSSLAQETTSSGPHKNGRTILFLKLIWHFITQYFMHTHISV